MTWTTPVSPVAGTVITVAWATANVVNPQIWLRLMTGNADPPGSSYVVVSSSPSATSWAKVTSDVIADGAVTAPKLPAGAVVTHLGYTPVNKGGDTMSGALTVPLLATVGGTGNKVDLLGVGGTVGIGIAVNELALYAPTNVSVTLRDTAFNGALRGTFWHSGTFDPTLKAATSHTQHANNLELTGTQVIFFPASVGRKVDLLGLNGTVGIGVASNEIALFGPTNVNITLRDSSPSGTLRGQVALQNPAGRVPNAASADSATLATTATTANNALALNGISDNQTPTAFTIPVSDGAGHLALGWLSGITPTQIASANVDGVAGTASMRTLGVGAQQAAAGPHTHANPSSMASLATGTYTGNNGGARSISTTLSFTPKLIHFQLSSSGGAVNNGNAIMGTNTKVTIMPTGSATTDGNVGVYTANGFSVPASLNVTGITYDWLAIG